MSHLAAELKTMGDNGDFSAVASMSTLDRDREVIDAGAFNPLPASIPVHAFHNFSDPVGRAVPSYSGGKLLVHGRFAPTDRAQEIRSLVLDGTIGHVSVGFHAAAKTPVDGIPHITKAELLEVSFVSVPSNREAAVLAVRGRTPTEEAQRALIGESLRQLEAAERLLAKRPSLSRKDPRGIRFDVEAFLRSVEAGIPPRGVSFK